eukprot:3792210-Rhodomonas_salina.1
MAALHNLEQTLGARIDSAHTATSNTAQQNATDIVKQLKDTLKKTAKNTTHSPTHAAVGPNAGVNTLNTILEKVTVLENTLPDLERKHNSQTERAVTRKQLQEIEQAITTLRSETVKITRTVQEEVTQDLTKQLLHIISENHTQHMHKQDTQNKAIMEALKQYKRETQDASTAIQQHIQDMIRTQAQATRDELQSITTQINLIRSQAQAAASGASGTHSEGEGRKSEGVKKHAALMAVDYLNTTITKFKQELDQVVNDALTSQFDREPRQSV